MAKYHVNQRGEAGVCRARKHCPFGDLQEDHYASAEEAREAFEASMRHETFASTPTPCTLTTEDLLAMDGDAQRRTMGAVWRVLKEMEWDEQGKHYWQAAYDSSEAGALWLERKRKDNKYGENPEYRERKAYLDRFLEEQAERPMPLHLPADPGPLRPSDFSTAEPMSFPDDKTRQHDKIKLALVSAAWMTALTPEETEAISWVTSNGASVLNTHINGEEHSIWGHDEYSPAFLDKTMKHFRGAMAKAPELEDPVIIYRGTSEDKADWTELTRPASASLSGNTAKGFRGDDGIAQERTSEPVILEIKTRKLPAVPGMSVWGMNEMEVLAPLGHYRKVGEFETLRGYGHERRSGKSGIDPEFDKIKVIQLEYVGTEKP